PGHVAEPVGARVDGAHGAGHVEQDGRRTAGGRDGGRRRRGLACPAGPHRGRERRRGLGGGARQDLLGGRAREHTVAVLRRRVRAAVGHQETPVGELRALVGAGQVVQEVGGGGGQVARIRGRVDSAPVLCAAVL